MDEDLVEQVVALSGRDVVIVRPRDSETLIDDKAFELEEYMPYWADLWPSAELLARTLIGRALRGARVLELGCGLGLPSIAAAIAGGRVLATDWSPEAVDMARVNAERNGVELEVAVCDWQEPGELLARGPWNLVLAADVLYERRNVAPLRDLLEQVACEAWLADPGRAPAETLLSDLEMAGWHRSEIARTTSPQVTVHRLTPRVVCGIEPFLRSTCF
jgi:predicted nicotinamide N-methyase